MKAIFAFCLLALAVTAQEAAPAPGKPQDPWSESTFSAMRLRSIGPALMSGRVGAIAVHPEDRATWYLGVSSGGVWKTTNSGTTWTPVMEREASYSIGPVVIDPKRPNTVWVGTGENNNQRSVGYGDGVYRSDDGGKTWHNLGLKQSEHIGKIVIDPRNSDVVYVAAQGPLWGPGGDRGLYKTTDGGRSWTKVLDISENTGVTDVVLDPHDPDVVLAAAHQRRRHVWTLIHGGPESGLHKSMDGGKTWRKIRGALPAGDLGRIGLAFSPAQKGLVYATVEAGERAGGAFRSLDSGESWEKRSDTQGQPMYYAVVVPDPNVASRVYMMDVVAQVSDDGGRTWRPVGEQSKHVDTHAYWIDPKASDHILAGSDGGLYESWDRGQIWRHFTNLSVTQFYNVAVDNAAPIYNVYGGTQDNSTLGGPSRTLGVNGAQNADWFIVTGGDGFVARIDPANPDIVYGESQYGGIVRLNRRTAERVSIRPVEGKGEPPLRFNWESPFIISPHSASRLYFGTNRVHRSDDRGNSWKPISPDLTRRIDRDRLPVMGRIWPPEAVAKHQSTTTYGTLTAVTESPSKEGLIYAGTDDGLIQVTEDGGATWRKIERIAGLPETSPYGVYVQRVVASRHDAGTVYALFDNHQNADFKPYVFKSTDTGRTWLPISGDLPATGPALALAEDPVNPNLLFAGTEFGLFFTIDGKKWVRLRGGLPTIPVRDLAIQERENDLVLATFGRGFYVLDDYSPLRTLTAETFNRDSHVFPIRKASLYVPDTGRGRGTQGEQLWIGENPPFGATITYWLKDGLKSKKQTRQDQAREAERRKEAPAYPTAAQLTAEADEEAPQVILTIADASGKTIRRLTAPATRGLHRVVWNLRTVAATLDPPRSPSAFSGRPLDPGGPFASPGTYKVTVAKRVDGVTTPLAGDQALVVEGGAEAVLSRADQERLDQHRRRALALQRSMAGVTESAANLKTRLGAIRRALLDSGADLKLLDEAVGLDRRATAIVRRLRGDETLRGLESGSPSSIQSRVSSAGGIRNATTPPTGTQQMNLQIALEELAEETVKLRQLEAEVKKLERQLDTAGVPHTPGRMPDLPK